MIESLYSVIVNWNLKEDTKNCIQSLLKAGTSLRKIIVVDNQSDDGSVTSFKENFGTELNIIVNQQNFGYARGLNTGIREALRQNAEWILLLNNDIVVSPTFYYELYTATQHNEKYKIFSPLILEYNRPTRIWFLGDRLIPLTLFTWSIARGKIDKGNLPAIIPVDFVSGCAMLVHRSIFDAIGMFSPNFFMYSEEVDFLQRARLAGFCCATATRAKMWHKISASSGSGKPQTRYLKIKNQIKFYKTYLHTLQYPLMFGISFLRAMSIAIADILHGQLGLIQPLVKGWYEGWFVGEDENNYDRDLT